MIGILLLIISLYLYFKPKYRHISYLIYLSFMLGYGGGFGLTTDAVIGVKNKDMAIIYTFIISLHLILAKQYRLPKTKFMLWYKLFLCFMICSIAFSYFHYGFSFYQILQGGRDFLLIFSLPILIRITPKELCRLMPMLAWITIVTSVLYFMQIVVGRPLMPYGEASIDPSVGLLRVYNIPALLDLFLALTFVVPEYFGKRVNILRIIFFIALICTLGRTGIFSSLMIVILSIYFMGKASRLLKTVVVLGILFIPFAGIISERFSEGGTSDDLSVLFSGAYKDFNYGDGGTMTYRIGWVYERIDYLVHRPLSEQIFGLGLISDNQPLVTKLYNFRLGLVNPSTEMPTQLTTPDIAYGNIISRLGFGGGLIYLLMLISLACYLYKQRRTNALLIVGAAQLIMLFLCSFAGSSLSEPKNLVMYFVMISMILHKNQISQLKRPKDLLLYKNINNKQ